MDNPRAVTPEEWLAARTDLLAREKEATRAKDAVDAARITARFLDEFGNPG